MIHQTWTCNVHTVYCRSAKSVDHLEHTVTMLFLHPCIPSPSFIYPEPPDIMDVDPSDILSKVEPQGTRTR